MGLIQAVKVTVLVFRLPRSQGDFPAGRREERRHVVGRKIRKTVRGHWAGCLVEAV